MKSGWTRFLSIWILVVMARPVLSQELLYPFSSYDPKILKPSEFLGYELGEHFSYHSQIEAYLQLLDALSDRAELIEYGKTYERRPLYLLLISAPQHLASKDSIKKNIRRLVDTRKTDDATAKKIIESLPAVVWNSYNVHGNEASSSEAAMVVAYNLIAGQDSLVDAILQNEIIIIDPMVNPDGRERYVQWVNSKQTRFQSDPIADEHNEPWPRGRYNHYLFDLNRDWAWMTQIETQSRIKAFHEWMPVFHGDYHEMSPNESYYFAPPALPLNTNLDMTLVQKWMEIYGKGWADEFDKRGWSYFTKEVFDLHYPGYGDSWPTLNGAVGVTFEQAGGGAGPVYKRADGTLLRLRERIAHHWITSLSTLKTTLKFKNERLSDFYQFWKNAIAGADKEKYKAYVIPPQADAGRVWEMIFLLVQQGLEVYRSDRTLNISRVSGILDDKPSIKNFPSESYIIPLKQPQRRFLQSLIELQHSVKDSIFYDISAWSVPIAFNVDCYKSEIDVDVSAFRKITLADKPEGKIIGGVSHYAYIINWSNLNAAKAVTELLNKNYKLSFASEQFRISGMNFERGSIVVFVGKNADKNVLEDVTLIAKKTGVDITATPTGWAEKGADLGSSKFINLSKPKILLVSDDPVSPIQFGSLWFMLDREYPLDYTTVSAGRFDHIQLSGYTTIILPESYGNYASFIGKDGQQKLKDWINAGGTLIAMGEGAAFAGKNQSGLTELLMNNEKKTEDKSDREKQDERELKQRIKYMARREREQFEQSNSFPGTILKIKIDTSHPLGYGYDDSPLYVMKASDESFVLTQRGYNVGLFTKEAMVGGYANAAMINRIADTAYLLDEPLGQGHVIAFSDDPNFRWFWKGTSRLMLNALFFVR